MHTALFLISEINAEIAERAFLRIAPDDIAHRRIRYTVQRRRLNGEEPADFRFAFAQPRVASLATRADVDVFGPGDPTPEDVETFWHEVDDIVGEMRGSATLWQRLRARLSLRSLRHGGPSWQAVRRTVAGAGASVGAWVRRSIRRHPSRGTESSDE